MQYLGTCMKRKSIIILTLILITICGLTIFTACGNEETNNQFVVDENGELVAYNGTATKITIPNSVKKIGVLAFYRNSKIKSVKLPHSVVEISASAFEDCENLTSVTFSDSLKTIGEKAFYGCSSLSSVELPSSVTNFGGQAFGECLSLKTVKFKDGITSIPDKAFYNCSAIEELEFSNTLKSIGKSAFYGCKLLKTVNFPKSLETINDSAFKKCSLKSVILPEKTWHYGAFDYDAEVLRMGQISNQAAKIGDYIDAYEKSIEQMGKTAIAAGENVHATANFKVQLFKEKTISLNVSVEAVYDKNESKNCALRIKVAGANDFLGGVETDVLSLQYLAADDSSVYFDMFGKKFKARHQCERNGELLNFVAKLASKTFGIDLLSKVNFDGFINDLASNFGNEFSANEFVEILLKNMFGTTAAEIGEWFNNNFRTDIAASFKLADFFRDNLFDINSVKKSGSDINAVWSANISSEIVKMLSYRTNGMILEDTEILSSYEVLDNEITKMSIEAKGAIPFTIEISDFSVKGIAADQTPIQVEGDYETNYFLKKDMTLKVDENALKVTTLNPYETTNLFGIKIKDICDEYYSSFGSSTSEEFYASLNVNGLVDCDLVGEIKAEFLGGLSISDRIKIENSKIKLTYLRLGEQIDMLNVSYDDSKIDVSKIKFEFLNIENEYVKVLKDLVVLKIATSLYEENSGENAEQIKLCLKALQEETTVFELNNLPLDKIFKLSIFNGKSGEEAEFSAKLNLRQAIIALKENAGMVSNNLTFRFDGLLKTLTQYTGALNATGEGVLQMDRDAVTGYKNLGIFDTQPIFGKDGTVIGYNAAATVDELYAVIMRRQADIVTLTDSGILPAIKYGEDGVLEKSFGREIGKDGWNYQTIYTLSKAETLVLWRVMSQNSLSGDALKAIGQNDETAIAAALDKVESCYKSGAVYKLLSIFGGSEIFNNIADGRAFMNKVLGMPLTIELKFDKTEFMATINLGGLFTATYKLSIDTNVATDNLMNIS